MKIKKILNPLIWLHNIINYFAYLEMYRYSKSYVAYNFEKYDIKYF